MVGLILTLIVSLFSGCSNTAEGKAVLNALIKTSDVTSYQMKGNVTIGITAEGLSQESQMQFNQIAPILSNIQMNMDGKYISNKEKTNVKQELNLGFETAGMAYKTTAWIDSDLTGSEPKLKEVIRIPAILSAAMPPEMAGKEYLVIDFNEALKQEGASTPVDYNKISQMSSGLQQQTIEFIKKYFENFNPGFNYIQDAGEKTVSTPKGDVKVHAYKIKLDDKTFKAFIRYMVNDMVTNKELQTFFVEYLKTVIDASVTTEEEKQQAQKEIENMFKDIENNPADMTEFNKFMDDLDKIQILGEKGIEVEYGIDENGYIVSENGVIDIKFNMSDIAKVDPTVKETGVINVLVKYDMLMYDINNSNIQIQVPETTPENSISFFDLMNAKEVKVDGVNEQHTMSNRIKGNDRYHTSAVISQNGWMQADNVVIAYGNDFPDALCASTLAKSLDAPILLVSKDTLPSSIKEEILRLNPANIYIVGGKGVIAEKLEAQVKQVVPTAKIERVFGGNRFETSVEIAKKINSNGKVVLAYGKNYADALSVAPFAAKMNMPILLVDKDTMDNSVKDYLKKNNINTVYIVGGKGVVSEKVEAQVKQLVPSATIERVSGKNRFDTNREIIKKFAAPEDYYNVVVAIGEGEGKFADALAGSAIIAKYGGVLVLVNNDVNKDTVNLIKEKTNGQFFVTVLGGEGAVKEEVVQKIFK